MVAYGIYKACRNYNISIPDDISIVGVDDISFSEIINPPLTTIAQPIAVGHLNFGGLMLQFADGSSDQWRQA